MALARKLLVALWRYVETGLIPTGAVLKAWNRPKGRRSVRGGRATAKPPGCDTPLSRRVPSTSAPVHAGSWSGSRDPTGCKVMRAALASVPARPELGPTIHHPGTTPLDKESPM